MPKYKYTLGLDGHSDAFSFLPINHENPRLIAQAAASDYHHQRGGWEALWPLEVEIFRDGESLGMFDVDRDMEPVFHAKALSNP